MAPDDGWIRTERGTLIKRYGPPKSRPAPGGFPTPMVISDTLPDPVQSMADGRYYSSKAALRATYKPGGNPQGETYIEVGNDLTGTVGSAPEHDVAGIDRALHKALARAKA